ncbi:hypothetical protein L1049_026953 [Liquidambar formosana]|uniref:Prolamin-like domain-containing protein n=1 Tax=Liquidambar formosana TaxID=63359 RepID=A0AAP0R8G1_LIQFO
MALTVKLFLVAVLVAWTMESSMTTAARPLDPNYSTLAARLQWDDSSKCWDSLLELQACSSEVILFFLNGETYLGPGCCQAIRTIEHQCWPSMLGSLGFTSEEGDILEGYCDAAASFPPPPPPSPKFFMESTEVIPPKGLAPQ